MVSECLFFLLQRWGTTGVLVSKSEGQYEGDWYMDLKHGKGQQMYNNGDTYNGFWEFDKVSKKNCLVLCESL